MFRDQIHKNSEVLWLVWARKSNKNIGDNNGLNPNWQVGINGQPREKFCKDVETLIQGTMHRQQLFMQPNYVEWYADDV